ncbi:response regulator transcription factor [Lampropedia aestuarii]|uniref:Response regulator transcription factor n=1 Tax=Lampropedia aestuarii TaxID=2562762 RepID=A0A4S5BG81_9BURK|nr:LytTR family DNA-binding domain-containing protein [Lampropedia aestuarii]THJ31270.1 response regulator transcription factor [Lampropedia aestuarii]
MNVLIVDDESLARKRLRSLLEELPEFPCRIMEASAVSLAEEILQKTQANAAIDLVLLDIQMPCTDGVSFAQAISQRRNAPAVVFVTAHAEYAAAAFDLEAVDYLTKPVRLERLRQALKRVQARRMISSGVPATEALPQATSDVANAPQADASFLIINERNRTERVAISQIVFCRAEMKYVTLHTRQREYLWNGSLSELERDYPESFLRIHRNALVARKSLKGLIKQSAKEEGDPWAIELHGTDQLLPVSRRMLPTVRAVLYGRQG